MNGIRYFSMFTGVGGFELGFGTTSNRNVKYPSKEENLPNSERDKPISERQQEGINNPTNNGQTESAKDPSGALLQNGQEQSNTSPKHLEPTKGNLEIGQQIRQASAGILREGDGIRDDKESMGLRKDSTYSKQFHCVGVSEIDKYASQLLADKFPGVKNWGDCTKIDPRELPDFDMLCGGFPCQAFSIAGKRQGFEDTRGTMFFEVARILEVKRPKIVLLENVKGLLNHNKGETFTVILETLDELGYEVQWMVLNSKFFGVPQNRERVFIIGNLRGEPRPEILPIGGSYKEVNDKPIHPTITEAIGRAGKSSEYRLNVQAVTDARVIGTLETDGWEKRHEQIRRVWDPNGTAPTIPTAQGGGVMTKIALGGQDVSKSGLLSNGFRIRRLTPLECERLQGFPDNWTAGFSDTQRYKMMGNAVTVNVIKAIADKL